MLTGIAAAVVAAFMAAVVAAFVAARVTAGAVPAPAGPAMQLGAALLQQVVDGGIQPGMSEPGVYPVPAAGHLMFQTGRVLGQTVQ